jgi:hypothetical protein
MLVALSDQPFADAAALTLLVFHYLCLWLVGEINKNKKFYKVILVLKIS